MLFLIDLLTHCKKNDSRGSSQADFVECREEGPFRIVIPCEKGMAGLERQATSLRIVQVH